MEDILIYSPEDLSLVDGIISRKLNSCMWNLRFYDAGSFQINLNRNPFKVGDVIQQGEKSGIVMKLHQDYNQTVVYGYTLNGITKFRHIYEKQSFEGTSESIITQVAAQTLTVGKRAIPKLSILQNQITNDVQHVLDFDNSNVFETLLKFSKLTEVSYDINFSRDELVFKCVQGRDRTDICMFGRRYRNMESMEYTQDDYNSKNVVYSSYEDDEGKTIYTTTGYSAGLLRRESGTKDNSESKSIIANNKLSQSLKGVANDKLKYKEDWQLGDYVTVAFDDLITEKQIVEVQEIHEKANTTIIPIFGEEKENAIRKIMRGGI